MLRRDQLCPGPAECGAVLMANPFATMDSPRCDECPLVLLDELLATARGQLIAQTIDLDFALQAGVTVTLAEIPYPEFLLLRLLTEERNRFNAEPAKDAHHGR
jgi:hypothetical protein